MQSITFYPEPTPTAPSVPTSGMVRVSRVDRDTGEVTASSDWFNLDDIRDQANPLHFTIPTELPRR